MKHVEQVGASAVADVAKMLRKLGTLARTMPAALDGMPETPHWQSQESTPWTQRKARRLATTPTDASIPDTQVTPASALFQDSQTASPEAASPQVPAPVLESMAGLGATGGSAL